MSLPDVAVSITYDGNGSTSTTYAIPFKFLANGHLKFYEDGVERSSGLTILGAGDDAGGTVATDPAVAPGTDFTIVLVMPFNQSTSFPSSGPFPETTMEEALDYANHQIKSLKALLDRCHKVLPNKAGQTFPTAADLWFKNDSNGDLVGVPVSELSTDAGLAAILSTAAASATTAQIQANAATSSADAALVSSTNSFNSASASAASALAAAASETAAAASALAAAGSETAAAASAALAKGNVTVADETARNLELPAYKGQNLVQLDDLTEWVASDTTAGAWVPTYPRADIIRPPQRLGQDRLADPNAALRTLVVGDSLGNYLVDATGYAARNEFFPDNLGPWSSIGLHHTALYGGTDGTDQDIFPMESQSGGFYKILTAGSIVSNFNNGAAGDVDCDSITVYYVKETGGGTFDLEIGPHGGAYTKQGATIDASVGAPGSGWALGIETRSFDRGEYAANIKHVSGTTKILFTEFHRSTSNGPTMWLLAEGGHGVFQWEGFDPTIIQALMAHLAPHVVLFQVEDSPGTMSTLSDFIDDWNGGVPDRYNQPEWVLITRPPWGSNSAANIVAQREQAQWLRAMAVTKEQSFIDMQPAFGNDPEGNGLTGAADDVHPTVPEGVVTELHYIFDRLPYAMAASPMTSRNNDLTNSQGILTTQVAPELFRRALGSFRPYHFPDAGHIVGAGTRNGPGQVGINSGAAVNDGALCQLQEWFHATGGFGTRYTIENPAFWVTLRGDIVNSTSQFQIFCGAHSTELEMGLGTRQQFGLVLDTTGIRLASSESGVYSESTESFPALTKNDFPRTFFCWFDRVADVLYLHEGEALASLANLKATISKTTHTPSGNSAASARFLAMTAMQKTSAATATSELYCINAGTFAPIPS